MAQAMHDQPAPGDNPVKRLLDPGWLYLLAGIALIASAVLIPSADDLDTAVWRRDRALAVEATQRETRDRYLASLDATRRGDERLLAGLALRELNLTREDARFISHAPTEGYLASLAPEPTTLPQRTPVDSTLSRLAQGETSRLWLLGGGAFALLIGLLPPASRGGRAESAFARPKSIDPEAIDDDDEDLDELIPDPEVEADDEDEDWVEEDEEDEEDDEEEDEDDDLEDDEDEEDDDEFEDEEDADDEEDDGGADDDEYDYDEEDSIEPDDADEPGESTTRAPQRGRKVTLVQPSLFDDRA